MNDHVPLPQNLREFVEEAQWTFAKTYAETWPHEYIVRDRVDEGLFVELVHHIRTHGYEGTFYKKSIAYFDEEGLVYWTMGEPVEVTTIINRCKKEQTYEHRLKRGTLPEQIIKPSEKMFGRDHLLRAWLQNRRSRNAHKDLSDYYVQVATAFATAFKVDLDHAPQSNRIEPGDAFGERSNEEDLHRFFMDVITARESCSSPFSSYMEAPKAICDLYQTFGSRLDETLGKFVAVHDELLLELIEKIWGVTAMDKVSQSALEQCGYPTKSEPDPLDYTSPY